MVPFTPYIPIYLPNPHLSGSAGGVDKVIDHAYTS